MDIFDFYVFSRMAKNATLGAENKADAAKLRAMGAEQTAEVSALQIERILMITEALWILLKKQHGYKDADLMKVINEIDLRDGVLDGRVAPKEQNCPHCNRPLAKARPLCIYCGEPVQADPFNR